MINQLVSGLKFLGTGGTAVGTNVVEPSGAIVAQYGDVPTYAAMAPQNIGLVLMGTAGNGIIEQKTNTGVTPEGNEGIVVNFANFTTANGLGSNYVASIYIDADNTWWAGTYHPTDTTQGGLSVSRDLGKNWETFRINGIYDPLHRLRNPKLTGMTSNNIKFVTKDPLTNKLVLASDDGVIISSIVNPNNIIPLTIEQHQTVNDTISFIQSSTLNGLASNQVNTLFVEQNTTPTVRADEPKVRTTWWAGTMSGLSRSFNQGLTWNTYDMSPQLIDLNGPALIFTQIGAVQGAALNATIPIQGLINPIQIQATDETGIQSVQISFDNQNFITMSTVDQQNYVTTYDSRFLPNGITFLYARATDIFGNQSQAVPLVLNINNPLPASLITLAIEEPEEDRWISGIFPIKLQVVSDKKITNVMVSASGPPPAQNQYAPATLVVPPTLMPGSMNLFVSIYNFLFDSTVYATGTPIVISAIATDENGRQSSPPPGAVAGAPAVPTMRDAFVYNILPTTAAVAVSGHTIWAGTDMQCGLSLSQDNGNTWISFTKANGLPSDNIQALAIRQNEIWVGTDNGLTMSKDFGRTWRNFTPIADNLPGLDVRSIAFQGSSVWVGTTNGVGKLSQIGMPFIVYQTINGIANNQINNIFVDCDQKTIWLSTQGGISRTTNAGMNWTNIVSQGTGLPSNQVQSITRYMNKLYVATTDGLGISSNEGKTFVRIGSPSIANNIVTCLKSDGNDLWIGTVNGLTKLDATGRFTTYKTEGVFSALGVPLTTVNPGLKSNIINSLAQ